MSLQTFGKSALRVAKNYTKGYSDVQAKVREATSNDPWGPSGTQMNEIAQMTYNQSVLVSHDSKSANIHAQKRLCRNNGDAG
jgi:epsin